MPYSSNLQLGGILWHLRFSAKTAVDWMYPECKERYRRIKAHRGHKKAIIAVCRMLLTAIWSILSKLEPYSAAGYLEDKLTEHSVVISKAQGLELLRKRGYIFRDEVDPAPA